MELHSASLILYHLGIKCLAKVRKRGSESQVAQARRSIKMANSRRAKRIATAVGMAAAVAAATWFVVMVEKARAAARESQCLCNLSCLALLLANYHDEFGRLPPAYLTNDEGEKLCSWRVLVLAADPAYRDIYDSYDFSQPWDGPANRELAKRAPNLYVCPNSAPNGSPFTSYLAVTGPGTAFDEGRYRYNREGDHQDIAIAESADSGVNWMEPRDFAAVDVLHAIESGNQGGISSRDPQGAGVILSNGVKARLGPGVTLDQLKAMIAPSHDAAKP